MANNSFKTHYCKSLAQYHEDIQKKNEKPMHFYENLCTCDFFKKSYLNRFNDHQKKFLPFSEKNIFSSLLFFEQEIKNNFLKSHNIFLNEFYFFLLYDEEFFNKKIELNDENIIFLKRIKGEIFNNIINNSQVLYSAYFFKYYRYLTEKDIEILLNRENDKLSLEHGVILSLFENNDYRVRFIALISLYFLTSSKKILEITLPHFINMMYDGNLYVQKIAAKLFFLLIRNFPVILHKNLFSSIVRLSKERNDIFGQYLRKSFFYLKYNSIEIFQFFNEFDFYKIPLGYLKIFIQKNTVIFKKLIERLKKQKLCTILYKGAKEKNCDQFNFIFNIYLNFKEIELKIDSDLYVIDYFNGHCTEYDIFLQSFIYFLKTGVFLCGSFNLKFFTPKINKLQEIFQLYKKFKNIKYLNFKFDLMRFKIESEVDLIYFLENFNVDFINRIYYDFVTYAEIYENHILITIESYFKNYYSYENMFYKIQYEQEEFYYEISYITYIKIPYIENKNRLKIFLCAKIDDQNVLYIKNKLLLI